MRDSLILILPIVILVSGCSYSHSVPIGCQASPFLGGCDAKFLITNISTSPNCICVETEICSHASLDFINDCHEDAIIERHEVISLDDEGDVLDVRTMPIEKLQIKAGDVLGDEDWNQYSALTYIHTEGTDYTVNQIISFQGRMGSKNVSISYVRTKNLC
jgi:hypothetical protein